MLNGSPDVNGALLPVDGGLSSSHPVVHMLIAFLSIYADGIVH